MTQITYLPTKFSSTELLPALWPPTTAIWGRSRFAFCPMAENASCIRLTSGIRSSMPRFPILPAVGRFLSRQRIKRKWNQALNWPCVQIYTDDIPVMWCDAESSSSSAAFLLPPQSARRRDLRFTVRQGCQIWSNDSNPAVLKQPFVD